jgi:transcriptional regulator with XRE-family HTH domain
MSNDSSAQSTDHPTLGEVIRNLRAKRGWTLKEMSSETGIPVSTLKGRA